MTPLHCQQCGAAMAEDQRYCVACGAQGSPPASAHLAGSEAASAVGGPPAAAEPAAPSGSPPRRVELTLFGRRGYLRIPNRRAGLSLAAGTLASGVLIGFAISPSAFESGASAAGRIIESALPGGGSGSGSSGSNSSSSTDTSTSPDTSSGSGPDGSGPVASPLAAPAAARARAGATAAGGGAAPADASSLGGGTSGDLSSLGGGDLSGGGGGLGGLDTTTTTTTTPTTLDDTHLDGTLVAVDPAAHSVDVADSHHNLVEVHATTSAKPGAEIKATTTTLVNGTLATRRLQVGKRPPSAQVDVTGTVSFLDAPRNLYALSARGVSLLVAAPAPAQGGPSDSLPSLGQTLEATVKVPPASPAKPGASPPPPPLAEVSHKVTGFAPSPVELTGLMLRGDPGKRTITLSADRFDRSAAGGATISLTVPASVDVARLKPRQAVVAHAEIGTDNAYKLTGIAPDDSETAANSKTGARGDFKLGAARELHGRRRPSR